MDDSGNGAVRCTEDLKEMSNGNMGIVLDMIEGLFTWYKYGGELVLIDGTE